MATAPVLATDWVTQEIQQSNPQAQAAEQWRADALSVTVTDAESELLAREMGRRIKEKSKEIAEYWRPLKQQADRAHKALTSRESELLRPLKEAEAHLSAQVSAYQLEQQRIAREAQRKAEEEARRKAEEEREALLEQIEAEGASVAEVAAVAAAPLTVAPVPIVATPSAEGLRRPWKARVKNKLELVQHVARNPALLHLLDENSPALNAMARAMKSAGDIPGVEFYQDARTQF